MLTKTDLYISCQTISNRDSSKMVFKTLVETTIIGGVFSFIDDNKSAVYRRLDVRKNNVSET